MFTDKKFAMSTFASRENIYKKGGNETKKEERGRIRGKIGTVTYVQNEANERKARAHEDRGIIINVQCTVRYSRREKI